MTIPGLVESPTRSNRLNLDLEDEGQRDWWIEDLWYRMDRDRSGTITRKELDCEQFHEVIRRAINPDRVSMGGAQSGRAEVNMKDAIEFCLRKADQNSDASLTLTEFRSLVACLCDPLCSSFDLAFALFDLDSSGKIDRKEFRELLRFFLGRNATAEEYRDEWLRVTAGSDDNATVTRAQYIAWVGSTPNGAISKHAQRQLSSGGRASRDILRQTVADRPKWNKRLATGPSPGHLNDVRSQGNREYFSRPQCKHELDRFYDSFAHTDSFTKHRRHLHAKPPPRAYATLLPKVLSSEGGTPMTLPGRHGPNGLMNHQKTGRPTLWEDNFVVPQRFRGRMKPADRPLASRATFGELQDSPLEKKKQRSGGGAAQAQQPQQKSWSQPTLTGANWARKFVHPGIEDKCDIGPGRNTTLEMVPW